jgi:hypothetical protein
MEKLFGGIGIIILGLAVLVILSGIMAVPVMWLWNGFLVPAVNGVHQISWPQAWGISILCGILFKDSGN